MNLRKKTMDILEQPPKQALEAREKDLQASIEQTLSARNKAQLAEILEQVCALQKAYGKTPEELETLVEGFAWALSEYKMYQIIRSMRKYVLSHSDIPAPADIIKIIDSERYEAERNKSEVSIETLKIYQEKGIPLTPGQLQRLQINL